MTEDPRDKQIRQLEEMLALCKQRNAELRAQIRALVVSGDSRAELLTKIDLLTSDLIETHRRLREARGRPS